MSLCEPSKSPQLELRSFDQFLFTALHCEADGATSTDCVEAEHVAHPVEAPDLLEVADADVAAEHDDVLIVELALLAVRVEDDVPADHVTIGAAALLDGGRLHGVAVDLLAVVEDALPKVVCGEG